MRRRPSALVSEAPGGTVKIDPAQWRLIASVGSGAGVGELSERLDASQLATGRLLRSLVEQGLVSIAEVAPAADPVPLVDEPASSFAAPAPEPEGSSAYAPFRAEPAVWADEPVSFNGDSSNGNGSNGNGNGAVDSDILFDTPRDAAPAVDADLDERVEVPVPPAPAVDAAEFARRLAELPPRAAKAVAAAARATSAEERQAALADLDGTGEEVDHEVLLQLLGPVEG